MLLHRKTNIHVYFQHQKQDKQHLHWSDFNSYIIKIQDEAMSYIHLLNKRTLSDEFLQGKRKGSCAQKAYLTIVLARGHINQAVLLDVGEAQLVTYSTGHDSKSTRQKSKSQKHQII